MKLIKNNSQIDLLKATQSPQSKRFMENSQIKDIIFMEQRCIALIKSHSISIFSEQHKLILNIELSEEVQKVAYSQQSQKFYANEIVGNRIVSINKFQHPEIESLYRFSENPWKNNNKQWAPWVLFFQQSEKLVVVRKFYGISLVVIFSVYPSFVKEWEFSCSQSSLSKMDEISYLVNFSQNNSRQSIKLQFYDIQHKSANIFKIQPIAPNITKSVKLYQRQTVQESNKQQRTWLTVVIGINYKIMGGGLLFIRFLEDSNNHYEIMASINTNSQIFEILQADNLADNMILTMDFRHNAEKRQTNCFVVNYKLENEESVLITDEKQISHEIQEVKYNNLEKQLLIFTNTYNKPYLQTSTEIDHILMIYEYKLISKKSIYSAVIKHCFLDQFRTHPQNNFISDILTLL